jgi:hypothetical protein
MEIQRSSDEFWPHFPVPQRRADACPEPLHATVRFADANILPSRLIANYREHGAAAGAEFHSRLAIRAAAERRSVQVSGTVLEQPALRTGTIPTALEDSR